ncbi:DUF2383 domain-containing protein [Bacillus sp. 1P06AnD]|uniref:DUF2383 domain-containing protein n=1 Tax=Bacillus sp. 1P06AnD TaxID=3132208 RepID=UPI0039A2BAE2
MEQTDVKKLNQFLKGIYMGVHAYEHFIGKCDDAAIKKVLQKIQQEHKFSGIRIAERIQNLGGTPVSDEGFTGSIADFIGKWTSPDKTKEILEKALLSERTYAVEKAGKTIKGEISKDNKKLIDDILERNASHVTLLSEMLQKLP